MSFDLSIMERILAERGLSHRSVAFRLGFYAGVHGADRSLGTRADVTGVSISRFPIRAYRRRSLGDGG
jgi:hypothetical protein